MTPAACPLDVKVHENLNHKNLYKHNFRSFFIFCITRRISTWNNASNHAWWVALLVYTCHRPSSFPTFRMCEILLFSFHIICYAARCTGLSAIWDCPASILAISLSALNAWWRKTTRVPISGPYIYINSVRVLARLFSSQKYIDNLCEYITGFPTFSDRHIVCYIVCFFIIF